jgi:hypothetical protein
MDRTRHLIDFACNLAGLGQGLMDDDHVTDPKENPEGTGHLPVSGEVGVGPAVHTHDPVTADTDDDPDHQPSLPAPEDQDNSKAD